MDVFEAMETCRAIRYLKPDPVPDALIEKVLHAATRASNPGNSQGWEFVVVRDAERKRRLGESLGASMAAGADALLDRELPPGPRRMLEGAVHLAQNLATAPVVIVVCSRAVYPPPPQEPDEIFVWSAVYPASQNLIVAARALGLGTTFTTLQLLAEKEVRGILGIPDDIYIGTIIPMGWPDRPFGRVARKPLAEVVHWDHW